MKGIHRFMRRPQQWKWQVCSLGQDVLCHIPKVHRLQKIQTSYLSSEAGTVYTGKLEETLFFLAALQCFVLS